jgi:hypothetical protein
LTLVVVIAAVAFGGWRLLAPQAERASNAAGDGTEAVVGTVSTASFTAAQASLEAQRHATGSYAGTRVQPPLTLVRADDASYCVQLDRPPQMQHLEGPGGAIAPGACR